MSLPVEPEQPQRVPDPGVFRDDPKLASGKVALFQYLAVGVFLFLITGFWDLQVRNPELYNERAERNRIKSVPVLAPRGKILDRDGRVIVDNHSSFSVILSRENLKLDNLRPIADGLNLNYEDLAARFRRFDRTRPKYVPMTVKEGLSAADLAFIESHRDPEFFPELEILHEQRRLYPRNQLAAHLLGYTGEVSESELDQAEFARHDQGAIVGKFGIERQYNEHLTGVDGQRRVIVDNLGRERQLIAQKDSVAGKNLLLTIDLDLQVVADLAMENKKGAVVALDPRNGEVLAMVSRPAFDPNQFAVRIQSAEWRRLVSDPGTPLLNRAIQAQFAPGSTFKPIMLLAGLETGAIDDGFSVRCGGGATFFGHYHSCWIKGGHGAVGVHRGMVQSCDVFFYNVGNRLGIDKIAFYAETSGFGRKTGIDLPQEKEGLVPSTQWKIRAFRQKWYPGETISVSIGQGALTVTPLQLAHAIGGLAMGGAWYRPHLVRQAALEEPRRWALMPENVRKV
ncbi:MAG: penicillin-binding protein 2, partial [Bryobacteraceae bacterium]